MRIADIRQTLLALGARDCHIDRVFRAWTQGKPLDIGTRRQASENFLPLALRERLPALSAELDGLIRLRSEHPGEDGSSRLLVELADGQTVESVLLPRDGLCVSTQVGCAVGCQFCMTGRDGLLRQVDAAEIVAQVVFSRRRRPVRRVATRVFWGEDRAILALAVSCGPRPLGDATRGRAGGRYRGDRASSGGRRRDRARRQMGARPSAGAAE